MGWQDWEFWLIIVILIGIWTQAPTPWGVSTNIVLTAQNLKKIEDALLAGESNRPAGQMICECLRNIERILSSIEEKLDRA